MPYATQQDLIDRFGQDELTQRADRDGNGSIDAATVNRALTDADDMINGYLASRYIVPIAAPVPSLIIGIACDLARYQLYTIEATDLVRTRFEDAIARLKDIQAGRVAIPVAGIAPPGSSSVGPVVSAPDRVFSADNLAGF